MFILVFNCSQKLSKLDLLSRMCEDVSLTDGEYGMARGSDDDIEDMNVKQLKDMLLRIDDLMLEKRASEQRALKEEMAARAAELGFSVEELFGDKQKRKYTKRSTAVQSVVVKYRNPDNPEETWSGRGRMSKWLADKIKKRGVTLEDFAV